MENIIISKSPKGLLSNSEIEEVISVIRDARSKKQLPALSYEYKRSGPVERAFGAGGELLYLRPKSKEPFLSILRDRVDGILKSKFGKKYKVEVY